jgi:hypothetical protein
MPADHAVALTTLPDSAGVRIIAADPAFAANDPTWDKLAIGLDKLFVQFQRESRVDQWAFALDANGAVIVLAWTGPGPLSGCSHDRIAKLLLAHQDLGHRHLLDAPPFVVVPTDGRARACDRAALRRLFNTGAVTAATLHYDLSVTDLATWRRGPRTLGDGPFAATLARWAADRTAAAS